MLFAIIKDGKVMKSGKQFADIANVFAKDKTKGLVLTRIANAKALEVKSEAKASEVKPEAKERAPLRNEGKPRNYRASTLSRIAAITLRGKETPRYALYARDDKGAVLLVAYTRTEKGAKYLRRKARGFTRRVLCKKYTFKVVHLDKAARKLVA